MAREVISTRLPEGITRQALEEKAREHHITIRELIQEGIRLIMGFNIPFYRMVHDFALGLKVPEWMVLENLTISWFAHREAQREVWGYEDELIEEFVAMDDKNLTGKEILEYLRMAFIQEEERERLNLLLEEEEKGLPLNDDDKAFLIRKRQGRTWLESEEYKREKMAEQEAWERLTPKQKAAIEYSLEISRRGNRIMREFGEEVASEYFKKVKEIEKSEGREAALKYTPEQ